MTMRNFENKGIFRGQTFQVSMRRLSSGTFTLTNVNAAGHDSGTDFEHYASMAEAGDEGARVARHMIESSQSRLITWRGYDLHKSV